MSLPKFTLVTRTNGANRALKEGRVIPKVCELEFVEVDPIIAAFRRMVRGNEFDICEMAVTTYICAKAHGKKMTAIPVPLVRAFHHGATLVNAKSGVQVPKDLEGRRVGVNRGYTVTTGVWARGIMADEYGLDLSKVTWVLSGDEHVAEYKAPGNVVPIEAGKKIEDMLASGELAAAIGADVKHPDVRPLIPNALEAGLAAYKRDGHYPINHLVVVKDEVLEKHPDLAADIFHAFVEAKRIYVADLKAGKIDRPDVADSIHLKVVAMGGAPLPYGVEPNRKVMETLIGHALSQGIIAQKVSVDELFAKGTWGLAG